MAGGSGRLGLKEVVAMGVGGMVSGGIYAVLGVAMEEAGNAVPLSYLLAGIITLLTAHSYLKLTLHFGDEGGVFTFVEHTVESRHLAAFTGWVLVVGYVGVMAMYAFAFGAYGLEAARAVFGVELPGILRPVLSCGIVALFVGLNLRGVEETGLAEDVAVYIKIFILLSLAGLGIAFFRGDPLAVDFLDRGWVSPVTAFAIIFVSFEGFQLLVYDYREIEDVERNLPRGMYLAIGISLLIYLSVSYMATLHLTPEELVRHRETALARAVSHIPLLGGVGFVLVILSAMKSTSSGINATLFGASRLVHRIATEGELPRLFSFRNREGIPSRALLLMGGLTALFAAAGTLSQITEFGSIVFLVTYAVTNWTGFRLRKETGSGAVVPLLGLAGTGTAIVLVVRHLRAAEPGVLLSVAGIFGVLLLVEFLYVERETVAEELGEVIPEVDELLGGEGGDGAGTGEDGGSRR